VVRPLWRKDGSVFYICYWALPAQSFLGLSPLVLATIFYCLRFETSLFVASYDSHGHGGGIRSRLHKGLLTVLASVVLITPLRGSSRKHRFELFLYCCMRICCRENVFTEAFPSSGRLFLLIKICCLVVNVVLLFVPRSLPRNVSIGHRINWKPNYDGE
jgi:hypothetical protein